MKKIILFLVLACTYQFAISQTDTSYQQYTGKFKFPDGSPVPETTITIENGILMAASIQGTTELKRREGDVFEIVAYSGVATFKRTEGKITSVQIEVGDLVMEGTKTEINFFYYKF